MACRFHNVAVRSLPRLFSSDLRWPGNGYRGARFDAGHSRLLRKGSVHRLSTETSFPRS